MMKDFLTAFLESLGALPDALIYVLLGVSAFVENLFPPVPGDTITALGAFLVGTGRLDIAGVYLATTLGSVLGFLALFQIGRRLGRSYFIRKDCRFLKAADIRRAEVWFGRYGYLLVLINRFLPGVRSAISLAGGLSRLKTGRVAMLALVSSGLWNLAWIVMGYTLGTHWDTVHRRMTVVMAQYNKAVLGFFALFLLFLLFRKKIFRRNLN